jgi:hypothetical protein
MTKRKIKKILLWLFGILAAITALWYSLFLFDFTRSDGYVFGVSYAPAQAEYLGLDPKETYLAILDDLKVRNLRISVYWNRIEKRANEYDFSELDWLMDEAQKRDAKVILAVGRRVPRWPECHTPDWAKRGGLSSENEYLLIYLENLVNHYKNHPALYIWQVENEPFLNLFGECPKRDKNLLIKEIDLVKKLDPNHPTMITDSGEFGSWYRTRHLSDYLGTSIYRVVVSWWTPYIKYGGFIPAALYRIKAHIAGRPNDKIIVSELQTEPWTPSELLKTPLSEQYRSMSPEQFLKNVAFAKKVGFKEIYLWGVEWWYWMKKQGQPVFWQQAKKLF